MTPIKRSKNQVFIIKFLIFALLGLLYRCGDRDSKTDGSASLTSTATPMPTQEVKFAFIADTAKGLDFENSLRLIKNQQAEIVLHQGDLGYDESNPYAPEEWNQLINEILGEGFPYFYSIGNHDVAQWNQRNPDGYLYFFQQRLRNNPSIICQTEDGENDLGIKSSCTYKNVFFLLSGIGSAGLQHETFIRSSLEQQRNQDWKICSWHKNQTDMQVGAKPNDIGWDAYQICQEYGAMVANGNEHTYSRTMTLTDIGNASGEHGAVGTPDKIELADGRTFVFVAGMGDGGDRYECALHDHQNWWASIYTPNHYLKNKVQVGEKKCNYRAPDWQPIANYAPGVLFITFNYQGNKRLAKGEFITTNGEIADSFLIESLDN